MSVPERCLILSSGRCGSTLLSNLIATEPDTLSIQESLIKSRMNLWHSDEQISGAEFWNILSMPSLQWKVSNRLGIRIPEHRYPSTGRWAGNLAALPPILGVTLSAISDDPDSLFDVLASLVPDFPMQTLAQHYVMLCDLLASLMGRRRWVERSGGSSTMAGPLLAKLPLDKVVYLTRGNADTALSMSRHWAFQFGAVRTELRLLCGFDPYDDLTSDADDPRVPDEVRHLLPEHITLETLTKRGGRLEHHELVCALMARTARTALIRHPPQRLLTISYEDLVEAPAEQLTRLAEFLGFADPAGWVTQVAGRVERPRRPGSPSGDALSGAEAPTRAVQA